MLKYIVRAMFFVVLFFPLSGVFAIGSFSSTRDVSRPTSLPEGQVSCFDTYRFGSVQMSMDAAPRIVTTGEKITFFGTVKNDNPYPVVGVAVYVKIVRIQTVESSRMRNGDFVVDEYQALSDLTIDAQSSVPAFFSWQVPENAVGGEYRVITYINSQQAFNLGGLSFTDDVTGNAEYFSVQASSDTLRPVELDRNAVLLNEKPRTLVGLISQVKKDESVTISVPLSIPEKTENKTISVTASVYNWDALKESSLIKTETRDFVVTSGRKQSFDLTLVEAKGPVTYVLFDLKDSEHHSFVGVRFARDGMEQARLNFPTLSAFPLQVGNTYQLTTCLHSASPIDLSGRTLELSLVDGTGKELTKKEFSGIITSDMMAYGSDFSIEREVKEATLTAIIKHDGIVEDTATMKYDCARLPSCTQELGIGAMNSGLDLVKLIGLVSSVMFAIFVVAVMVHKKKKSSSGAGIGVFLVMVSVGWLVGASSVQAKSVSWSNTFDFSSGFYSDAWIPTTFYSEGEDHFKILSGNFAISYNATASVADNSTLNVGDTITFSTPMNNTDISWSGTGSFWDTPFGFYDSVPPTSRCDGVNWMGTSPPGNDFWAYMVTQKPAVTVSGSGLTCTGLTCTVTSAGPITATVTFATTTSGFDFDVMDNWTFITNGSPLPACVSADTLGSEDSGSIVIPEQAISFNFNAIPPAVCTPNSPLSFPPPLTWLVTGTNIGATCDVTLSTNKATYAPGETMTVSYSATVRANTGWARNILADCDVDLGPIDGTVTLGNTYANVTDAAFKVIDKTASGTFDWVVPAVADGCHSLPVGLHLYGGGQSPVGSFDGAIAERLNFTVSATGPSSTIEAVPIVIADTTQPWWQKLLAFFGIDTAEAVGSATIDANDIARVSWRSTEATSCVVRLDGIDNVDPTYATSGGPIDYSYPALSVGPHTFTINCTGPSGNIPPDSVDVMVTAPVPSGTVSVNGGSCAIATGSSTCDINFTWNIVGTSPNLYNATTGVPYSTSAIGTDVAYGVTHGNNTVEIRDGVTVLGSVVTTATCSDPSAIVDGGGVCIVPCVQNVFCTPAEQASVCQGGTFNFVDNCGTNQSCPGTRACNYNWKEVAP